MNEFNLKAAGWDQDPMRLERSQAVANGIINIIPLSDDMTVLEYGSGTGLTSFLLKDHVKEITMMDNSAEMVKIMNKKILDSGVTNLKTVFFDLEKDKWEGRKFDIIITQMVLHHILDYKSIIKKFHQMLNPEGYMAIADLYSEDGSFHGEGFKGYRGFDIVKLTSEIRTMNFDIISANKCFSINKRIRGPVMKQFDLFLLLAKKLNK